MRRLITLGIALFLLVSTAIAGKHLIVGKWRLKTAADSKIKAAIRFNSNKTGTMSLTGAGNEEVQFRYSITGDELSMRATKFTRNGKVQKPPMARIVLRLSWRSKDKIEVQEVEKGVVKKDKDVLVRVK